MATVPQLMGLGMPGPLATAIVEGAGGGLLQSTRTTLSSFQLLHLFSAPIIVVPTPGPGKLVVVTATIFDYTFVSTRYVTTGFGEGLYYKNDLAANGDGQTAYTIAAMSDPGSLPVFLGTQSEIAVTLGGGDLRTVCSMIYPGNGTTGPISATSPVNQPVVFGSEISNMTSGNGTATLTVFYLVVTL